MRLCKDCRWMVLSDNWYSDDFKLQYAICGRLPTREPEVDLVTGRPKLYPKTGRECQTERHPGWLNRNRWCGVEGRYWIAKVVTG